MWKFSGVIEYTCEVCGYRDTVSIDDFEIECVASDERQMGPENSYLITYFFDCPQCGQEISLAFDAYEYPVDSLNYVGNTSYGANTKGEPYIEYLREIYYVEDILELYDSISELVTYLKVSPELIRELTSREFEEVIAELFRSKGFQVDLTKRTRDGGKDIIAIHTDVFGIQNKYFIECKHYAETNKVGVDVVRTLHGVKNTKDGPNKTIVATTSTFTTDARKFVEQEIASKWDMSLADYDEIVKWIHDYK